jgi:hypothetical protein
MDQRAIVNLKDILILVLRTVSRINKFCDVGDVEGEKSPDLNKTLRRKQRGINYASQPSGSQPAFAPRGGELNPQ